EYRGPGARESVGGRGAWWGNTGGFTPHAGNVNNLSQGRARRQLESPPINVVTQIAARIVRQLRFNPGPTSRDGQPLVGRVASQGNGRARGNGDVHRMAPAHIIEERGSTGIWPPSFAF